MDPSLVIEWSREALRMALLLGGPLLVVALVVGLVIGAGQTLTQMHEPTVALIPRLAAVAVALLILLPWMLGAVASYTARLIGSLPDGL